MKQWQWTVCTIVSKAAHPELDFKTYSFIASRAYTIHAAAFCLQGWQKWLSSVCLCAGPKGVYPLPESAEATGWELLQVHNWPPPEELHFSPPSYCSVRYVWVSCSKKRRSRVPCLQKLSSLNVTAAVLHTLYQGCIKSVSKFSFLRWFGGLSARSKNFLNKVVNVYGKVVGEQWEQLGQLYESCAVQKAKVILNDKEPCSCESIRTTSRWLMLLCAKA